MTCYDCGSQIEPGEQCGATNHTLGMTEDWKAFWTREDVWLCIGCAEQIAREDLMIIGLQCEGVPNDTSDSVFVASG